MRSFACYVVEAAWRSRYRESGEIMIQISQTAQANLVLRAAVVRLFLNEGRDGGNIVKSLAECEVENLSAWIKKLNLKCAIANREVFLADQLIHARFANFAGAVRPRVDSVLVAWR